MRKSFWYVRIPNLFALFFLVVGVFVVSYLTARGIIFEGRAGGGSEPKNVRISNITDANATISFTTDVPSIASVSFGTDASLGTFVMDDRDKATNTQASRTTHYFTLANLQPDTNYYFSLLSADTQFQDGEKPYSFTSGKAISNNAEQELQPLQGKIIRDDGAAPAEGIVYVTSGDMQLLSTLLLPDGRYSISFVDARTKDATKLSSLQAETVLELLATTNTETATATLFAKQDAEIPTITLSKTYDFTTTTEPLDTASESASAVFPPSAAETGDETESVSITSPETNEEFLDAQPLFSGTAIPNESVEILIESEPITAIVTADANGRWQFRPSSDLPPGEHTLTIKTKNALGILTEIRQSFTVFAQGSQFVEPSGIPTLTGTPIPTASPTSAPSPTTVLSETPTKAPTETLTPTPTTASSISRTITQPPVPKNLGSESLIFAGVVSIVVSGVGLLMFLLTRKGGVI